MQTLVLIHMVAGSAGIVSGLIVVVGMFRRKTMRPLIPVFLTTTLLACVTGFWFLPVDGFTSAQLVGVFTTILLGMTAYAFYIRRLSGNWNQIYIMTAVEAIYLNVLIAIAQSFQHLRFLKDLAPSQSSSVYIIAKLAALMLFIVVGFFAVKRAGGENAG